MKRILTFIAALSLGIAANAQISDSSIYSNDHFEVDGLEYFGFGFHLPSGDEIYTDNTGFGKNREIFFNLVQFKAKVNESNAFTLGVDLNWDAYRLDKDYMWFPAAKAVGPVPASAAGFSKVKKSTLRVFSFDVPLDYNFQAGNFKFTVGAAAEFNFPGRTKFKGTTTSGQKVKNTKSGDLRVKDIKTDSPTWNFHAAVSFYKVGLYAKYSPESQFKKNYGPDFSYWTVGLIWN